MRKLSLTQQWMVDHPDDVPMMTIRTKVAGLIISADETSVPVHGAHCSTPGYPLLADQRPRLGRRGAMLRPCPIRLRPRRRSRRKLLHPR
jgi:hypothetical protein